ncbi:transcriptional regulator with XRE-family HTH domain [Polaromonas sp. CG_9.5]|uniref:helix-turn-helix domain-containing protein n=1 Tax=Polaromonas sp. CG_9.5 TaxID=3071705 RepID=UPI002DF891AB|nr:transcriptional regulator with XRE-family HTH domain [Polaromonas sp. CG_9.5]
MTIKLKLLRTQAGMTLEELAQATELTRSYVSKVERGLANPSVGVALKLAKALRLPVDELFGQTSNESPVTITRAEQSKARNPEEGSPRLVAGNAPGQRVVAFVLQPGREKGLGHLMSHHEGEELIYVLSGSVNLELDDKTETLAPGDCAHFNASVPHRLICTSEKPAEVLLVIAGI